MSEAEELNNHNDPIVEDDEDDDDDEDDSNLNNEEKAKKRKERLEQNRISARESRKRKKTMIEELQRTVITLSRENKDLNERNESLRRQLMEIGSKYPNVVPLQAIVGQAVATAGPSDGGGTTTTNPSNLMANLAWMQGNGGTSTNPASNSGKGTDI